MATPPTQVQVMQSILAELKKIRKELEINNDMKFNRRDKVEAMRS